MNANVIEIWVKSLGKGHGILVENRLLPDLPLQELYPGRELLHIEPEPGLALSFWAESKRFETLFITLIATTPPTIGYKGELPMPFVHTMTQSGVRSSFGEPMASKGPARMPKPMGATGGVGRLSIGRCYAYEHQTSFQVHAGYAGKNAGFFPDRQGT